MALDSSTSFPQEFIVIIDCQQSFRLSMQLEGEQLGVFVISTRHDNYFSDEQSLLLQQLDWPTFWSEMDEIGLWQWARNYQPACSQCQWGIQIDDGDREMISECKQGQGDELPVEDNLLFRRFIRALGELCNQDLPDFYENARRLSPG